MNAWDHYDRLRLTSESQALEREHLLGSFSSGGSPEGQTLFALYLPEPFDSMALTATSILQWKASAKHPIPPNPEPVMFHQHLKLNHSRRYYAAHSSQKCSTCSNRQTPHSACSTSAAISAIKHQFLPSLRLLKSFQWKQPKHSMRRKPYSHPNQSADPARSK